MNKKVESYIYYSKMFTLITDQSKYIQIRYGVTAKDIWKNYQLNVSERLYDGKIILRTPANRKTYRVEIGDTYSLLAEKLNVEEDELRIWNDNMPLYPGKELIVSE